MIKRYLESIISKHLASYRQMVFLVGPRQVGKTTLAKGQIPRPADGVNYFNWDVLEHRKLLSTQIFPGKFSLSGDEKKIIVFDEIHKYPRWKNALKGLFDTYEPNTHWIVTGSASLNVFRKGQDSLVGRSFTYNLAPLSVAEILNAPLPEKNSLNDISEKQFEKPDDETQGVLNNLLNFGGFPEPYLNASADFLARWRASRLEKLINQDLAKIEHLKNLSLVENLMFLMPERVGSPLSVNTLREDLEVHFSTVKNWLGLLERVFYGFSIRPFSASRVRMLKKEAKWYLWDWTEVLNAGVRFENLVAVHLIKYVNFVKDAGLNDLSLHYVRDKEKREVDFLICRSRKPVLLIECKSSDASPHKPLAYFAEKLGVKNAVQLVAEAINPRIINLNDKTAISILPAAAFLRHLV